MKKKIVRNRQDVADCRKMVSNNFRKNYEALLRTIKARKDPKPSAQESEVLSYLWEQYQWFLGEFQRLSLGPGKEILCVK